MRFHFICVDFSNCNGNNLSCKYVLGTSVHPIKVNVSHCKFEYTVIYFLKQIRGKQGRKIFVSLITIIDYLYQRCRSFEHENK